MIIGEAAKLTNLNAKTIRFYEDIKLVVPARAANGYRIYSKADIQRLQFVQRSRSLGFTVEDCRLLLSLYEDKNRTAADVKKIAIDRVNQVDTKIKELLSLKEALVELSESCHGDDRPVCPILDDLSGQSVKTKAESPA